MGNAKETLNYFLKGIVIEMIIMSGIVFFKTKIREKIVEFYVNKVEMSIWLEQKDCTILKHGNLLLGFCQRDKPDIEGMITFFYPTREEVDKMYERFKKISNGPPKENPRYQIYHFFTKDPEGRNLEFQHFMHALKPI